MVFLLQLPVGFESGAPVTSACAPLSFQYKYDTAARGGKLPFYFHSTSDSKCCQPCVRFPRHSPPPLLPLFSCPAASQTATLATSVMHAARPWQHRTGYNYNQLHNRRNKHVVIVLNTQHLTPTDDNRVRGKPSKGNKRGSHRTLYFILTLKGHALPNDETYNQQCGPADVLQSAYMVWIFVKSWGITRYGIIGACFIFSKHGFSVH